jgi:hypothetical protein
MLRGKREAATKTLWGLCLYRIYKRNTWAEKEAYKTYYYRLWQLWSTTDHYNFCRRSCLEFLPTARTSRRWFETQQGNAHVPDFFFLLFLLSIITMMTNLYSRLSIAVQL